MKIYQTQDIRNIALVGGAKSGKTTMAEAMAFCGGLINRRGNVTARTPSATIATSSTTAATPWRAPSCTPSSVARR